MFWKKPKSDMSSQELAAESKQALDNYAMGFAFDKAEQEILDVWATTGPLETEEREFCFHQFRALRLIQSKLKRYIADAKFDEQMKIKMGEVDAQDKPEGNQVQAGS